MGTWAILSIAMVVLGACTVQAPAAEQGWSAPVVEDSFVYIGSRSGRFFKLSTAELLEGRPLDLDGDRLVPKWQFPVSQGERGSSLGAIYGRAVIARDVVYVALNRVEGRIPTKGLVTALDRDTGVERRSYETEGRILGSPVLDGDALYVADDKGIVYALDSSDVSRLLWKQPVAQKRFWSSPSVSGTTLYVGSMDHSLYALDTRKGAVIWSFQADGAITSQPLVVGDYLYFGALDRKFYCVNAASGDLVWSVPGDGWFWNDAIASADERTIFVGSLGETFYALDAKSGVVNWAFATEAAVRAAPVLVGNLVYVVAESGRVFALDSSTGNQRRSIPVLGEKVLASPAWDGGFLYLHDMKEGLHKIAAPR